jgi:hypothetical protein
VSSRTEEARAILGPAADVFTLQEYQCDPESCGHSDSIILRAPGYTPVCFSLDDLRREVSSLLLTLASRPDLGFITATRLHFLGVRPTR